MTRILLIRHATIEGLGQRIAGRSEGVSLTAYGREQAERLVHRLASESIQALYTSPQPRAFETAENLARRRNLEIQIAQELDELDFGDWTGKTYEELTLTADWREFNILRSSRRIPNGETLLEVQARIVKLLAELAKRHQDQTIALVSHGDVIRLGLAFYLGMPIDLIPRYDISPASVSALELDNHMPRVLWLNRTDE